jgi:hypothetical protein
MAVGTKVHIVSGRGRTTLTEIEESRFAIGEADEHEAAATKIAGGGVSDGEGEGYGYRGIDGIAAGFENGLTGIGGVLFARDHHGVQGADGLPGLQEKGREQQTDNRQRPDFPHRLIVL